MGRHYKFFLISLLLLIVVILLGILIGSVRIPVSEIFWPEHRDIVYMRAFRIFIAMMAGSGLSVCGIVLQAVLKNPLADPYLLGTSSGAGLAAVIALITGIPGVFMPLTAFVGAICSIVIVYLLARERGRIADTSLLLAGVIISMVFSSIIVFLVSLYGSEAKNEIVWWLWGGFSMYDYNLVAIVSFPIFVGIGIIYFFAQDLNAITMGDEDALHLGVDSYKIKKILIFVTAVITGGIICVSGIIGFVGLIVPHIVRLIIGHNHKILIPAACLAASVFMISCDLIARTMFAPVEIPVGVITAVIGSPVFIILLKRRLSI